MIVTPVRNNIINYNKKQSYNNSFGSKPEVQRNKPSNKNSHNDINKKIGLAVLGAAVLGGIVMAIKKKAVKKVDTSLVIDNGKDFKELLTKLTPENYKKGDNFMANLHIHSSASDGKLSPLEILNQAKEHADKLPEDKHFVLSVTDHDSIDGVKEIVRIIKKSPEDYKKIKFVPGVEFSVKFTDGDLLDKPLNLDMLAYGFNPEDTRINKLLDDTRRDNLNSVNAFFEEMNEHHKDLNLSGDDASSKYAHIKNTCSAGLTDSVRKYTSEKMKEVGINDFRKLDELFEKHFGVNKNLTNATPEMSDVIKTVVESGGEVSLAHPGRINLAGRIKEGKKGLEVTNKLLDDFNKAGGNLIESYYQKYKEGNQGWWNRIKESYEKSGLKFISTGGYDSHGEHIDA